MFFLKINKTHWTTGIEKAQENYNLFAPVKDENGYFFKEIGKNQVPDIECPDTIMSPKSILFPQTEKILETSLDESTKDHHQMKRTVADYTPRAVLGIRPYDAKAIELVKLNFINEEYTDPYWKDLYEATTFVGMAVHKPSQYDFSTSVDCGPFSEQGLDILLADMDDHYLAKVLTEKGENFSKACGFKDETDAKEGQVLLDVLRKEAEKNIKTVIETNQLSAKNILDLHEAPFWEDIAFSCINCGTCTYICPTCWCFDIQDEVKNKEASRFRNWDTCMSSLFTRHATGHNPRATKLQRVRQRFMHKLKYFLDKYDQGIMCVGCGRCVKSCPVNIDIRTVAKIMNSLEISE